GPDDVPASLHRDRRARADRRSPLQEPGRPIEEPQADERGARSDPREKAERRVDRGAQSRRGPVGTDPEREGSIRERADQAPRYGPAGAPSGAGRDAGAGAPGDALAHARRDSPR